MIVVVGVGEMGAKLKIQFKSYSPGELGLHTGM